MRRFREATDATVASIPADDVVLVRADLRTEAELTLVADAVWSLERRGVRCLPSAEGLVAAEDKFRTFVRLRTAGVSAVTTTALVAASAATGTWPDVQARLQAYPLVVKRTVGWGGRGTVRCDDAAALRAVFAAEARERPEGLVLVQPFVRHARAVTVLVAGDRVVSAWGARAAEGEFRTNPGLGGATEDVVPDETLGAAARTAARACSLEFAGVEFLDDGTAEPPVIEVNAMPGLWPDDADDREFADAIVALALGQA